MFEAVTPELVRELEDHLPSAMAEAQKSAWTSKHIVKALTSCSQDVLNEMRQNGDMLERQRWQAVYLGIESMVTVLDWLNTGMPPRTTDLQW
jgi:hypothetical protein